MVDYTQGSDRPIGGGSGGPREKLRAEALERLADARQMKMPFELDMREAYWFAAPHRARSVLSTTRVSNLKPRDDSELNTSFAFEVAGDFPTVMLNTFLPEAEPWAVRKAGWGVPDGMKDQIDTDAAKGTKKIFEAIGASNFYAECGKGFTPDLALGTVAMWVEASGPAQPLRCQAVPIRELEINVSPYGDVDDRFVVRWTKGRYVRSILKGLTLPQEVADKIDGDGKGKDPLAVVWGFWRVYDDREEEAWQSVVLVDNELVGPCPIIRGTGCCPLIVGRFNPSPEWPWGVGPLIQALPDLRTLDEMRRAKIKNLNQSIDPAVTWPDDSYTNLEEGIESGMAYPIRPGTSGDIKNIYQPNPPDAAIYDLQALEQSIKRLFFLDWPEQRGDTPPTATQWLDQMTMAQRRIGTPGLPFWREFCAGCFVRFQYLLEKAGMIQPVEVDGKIVALQPFNPAQRAADQQDVAQFARYMSIVGAAFPEETKVGIDGTKVIKTLAKLMGIEDIVVPRDPDQVKAAIQQIAQLQQGKPPGAPDMASAGAGPPPQDLAGPPPAPTQVQLRGRL